MGNHRVTLTIIAVVGAGATGGVYLAFSTFVMRALRRLPAPHGMAAMQAINREAPSPLFMTALFGTAAACLPLAALAVARREMPDAPFLFAGASLYLATVGLTVAYHVPRNEALAAVAPESDAAPSRWTHYARSWTRANHLRTLGALAATAAFAIALTRT